MVQESEQRARRTSGSGCSSAVTMVESSMRAVRRSEETMSYVVALSRPVEDAVKAMPYSYECFAAMSVRTLPRLGLRCWCQPSHASHARTV